MKNIVIGKIKTIEKLTNKLKLCKVDIGDKKIQIITGAHNVAENLIVVVALPGATINDVNGGQIVIDKKDILNKVSEGAICSSKELGISDDHSGILVLDKYYKVGNEFDTNQISENPRWMKYINMDKINKPQMDVITDEAKIDEVLSRGIKDVLPNLSVIKKQMLEGKRLRLYTGIDPTANFIHMGHYIWMKKLAQFQKLGHEVIFLIGGFTAMIGDPDKKYSREPLTKEQVWENFKSYKDTAAKILDFEWSKNPITILNNYDWLSTITLEDWLQIMGSVTMQHMISHDMFKTRLEEQKPIRLNELTYPLMQGFDGVAMRVDLEIGGSDQTFNMLTGRILSKELINKEKHVITLKLLTDNSGKKMGKTTGNAISSLDTPEDMYGKVMSWNDSMIYQGFESLTDFDLNKYSVANISKDPMKYKKELAFEVVKSMKSETEAIQASKNFERTIQHKDVPDTVESVSRSSITENNISLKNLLKLINLVDSNSDAKRLIMNGAVELDGEKVTDPNLQIDIKNVSLIKAGKRNWKKFVD